MKPKFEFNDVVIISSERKTFQKLTGKKGVILSLPDLDEYPRDNTYLVVLLNEAGTDENLGNYGSRILLEHELTGTGRKIDTSKMYTGDVIRVSVDPNTGEGKVIGTYKKKKKPGMIWD